VPDIGIEDGKKDGTYKTYGAYVTNKMGRERLDKKADCLSDFGSSMKRGEMRFGEAD
jgi:hypothetical protein